jgi:arylsulfatase A-like enzyme
MNAPRLCLTRFARRLSGLIFLAALPAALAAGAAALPAARPNIIIILSDDMGYSDLGCFGSEIATPNLDALAAQGVRFTQFYNNARCCPTRASLLTGLYSHQAGIGHMVENRGAEAYRGDLNRRSVTLAEAVKPAGYRTYMTGKWHVTPGKTAEAMAQKQNWPLQRGFDRYYGTINGSGSFWDPHGLVRDNREITIANDSEYKPGEYYYTDAISDHATRFIREHKRDHAGNPFLIYVAYTAAHWPMHARERDIAKYRGRYNAGYGPVSAARWAKQIQLGVVQASWGLPPPAEDWAQVKNREFEARCMEVFAAMVTVMDEGIGRIVAELKSQGQLENTLICFLQDNGGCAETNGRIGDFRPRADRPSLAPLDPGAAHYGNLPTHTRDGWPLRQGYGVMPGPADTYVAYGRGWANVSNTPFREYKHWVHEGGISTPLIVHWPAGMKTAGRRDGGTGRLCSEPSHLIDLMATCVDLAEAKYPTKFNGQPIHPMEGRSLKSLLVSASPAPSFSPSLRPLYWEHEGNRAIRVGRWKLVSKHPDGWELYDIDADRTEQHDLAAQQPDRVKQMAAQWDAWANRVGVRPWAEIQAAAPKTPITNLHTKIATGTP